MKLNNNANAVSWDSAIIGTGNTLILGHATATHMLDFRNGISFAGQKRAIQVEDGAAAVDATLSGKLTGGTSSGFTKTGPGALSLTNATNDYTGVITVEPGATLAVNRSDTVTQGTNPFKVALSGDGGFTQAGSGSTVLMLANTYIGPTNIDAGTLTLGAAGVLPDLSEVSIGNATLAAGSFAETAGRLVITGTATLNLGTGAALSFADSAAVAWTGGILNLTGNFVSGSSLRFGANNSGLVPGQLAHISVDGFTGFALNATGYLVANEIFSSWIAGNFTNGSIPSDKRGPSEDFDKDGLSNLVEFAIAGQDPTVANSSIGGFTGNTLSFTKRAGTSGLTYTIQQSSDLGVTNPWTAVTGASYVNNTATVSYSLPVGGPARVFLRLQVLSE